MPYPGLTLYPGPTTYPGITPLPGASSTIALTASSGLLVLNAAEDSGLKWVVRTFEGWGGAQPTIDVVQKPRQSGGWAGLSYAQPRYLHIGVRVYAPSPATLTNALDRLYAAVDFDDVVVTVAETGFTRSVTARRSDAIVHTRVTNMVADVEFQMVAVDPRKMGGSLTDYTYLPASSGGLTIPFTVPFSINSTVESGQINMTNPGNTAGPVGLRIDGPCTGPVITHASASTTNALVFSSNLTLAAGEYLLVDMDKRLALANGQASRAGYITSRGWSAFDPGPNTWAFTATGFNSASQLTVTAAPAWR